VNSLLKHRNTLILIAVVGMMLALSIMPAGAQTATPVPPTAVPTIPVSIDLPVGVIFSETNNWIEQFAPLAAIGIGITIALAVLGYLGHMIVSAFKG
jgi:hypothetical protein